MSRKSDLSKPIKSMPIEYLHFIERIFFDGMDFGNQEHLLIVNTLMDLTERAKQLGPEVQFNLSKAIFLKPKRKRRAKPKRLEEIMQLYGFTIKPEKVNGRCVRWCIWEHAGTIIGESRYLKQAVEQAVAFKQREEQERTDKPLLPICHV